MNDKNAETLEKTEIQYEGTEFAGWKKKIALFLAGQTVSLFGSSLVQFAIIWYITLSTKSGAMMMISTLCSFLPQIVISPFSGVWADRYNRRFLIIAGDILVASSTLILAILFLLGYGELWLIFVISGIRSMGTGIQMPAVNALLPQIVPVEKLTRVNGINGSIQSLVFLESPAASGALMTFASMGTIFFVDVITAVIAISIMLKLNVPAHKRAAEQHTTGYLDDFKSGLGYIVRYSFLKNLMIFYAILMFLIVPAAFLTPLLVTRVFGDEVWKLTANEMLFSAGSILGGLIIAAWGGFKNRIHMLGAACIAFGVLTFALGFASIFAVFLAIMFITGVALPFFNTASMVLIQEKVEQQMHGRVFSFMQIISSASMPAGMLLFGPIADIIRIEVLLIATGLLMFLLGVAVFCSKLLRTD